MKMQPGRTSSVAETQNHLPPLYLGVEGGATRTTALLVDSYAKSVQKMDLGPGNLRLLTDAQLNQLFRAIKHALPTPTSIAIGLAGARTIADRERIRTMAAQVWPGVPCYPTNDLETALAAADPLASAKPAARVLVLSGTGSCCYGQSAAGVTAKVGGWGHLLGDHGSAYDIGLQALQRVIEQFDRDGRWPRLGQRILCALLLNEPNELIPWIQAADKTQIAALAVEVFAASSQRDKLAADILAKASGRLAADAASCAQRLVAGTSPVQFVLAGGNLLKQPGFVHLTGQQIRQRWPNARIAPLRRDSVWGAVALARAHYENSSRTTRIAELPNTFANVRPDKKNKQPRSSQPLTGSPPPATLAKELQQSPTEQRNPRSMRLDRLSLAQAIKLMLSEDAKIPPAILAERAALEKAIRWIVRAFRHGGRLFYVGAGTSGRLGVLDASECPPTFRTDPKLVQGIMAGGQHALWQSVEGAEDDQEAGARAILFRGVQRRDVVVGIAASGRTPFVWGALREAKRRCATTILLTFNPNYRPVREDCPDLIVAPRVGPEVLTGSTRLKAGTATKIILNMLTTLVMVKMGKVISNLMVDLNPSNAKLRERAVRIVRQLTGTGDDQARMALESSGWVVAKALKAL